jgi:hypothetical protein
LWSIVKLLDKKLAILLFALEEEYDVIKVCGYPPTVEEEFLSYLPKPAKSLARVPSLWVLLVILPGSIPVPRSVEGFDRNSFLTSVFVVL